MFRPYLNPKLILSFLVILLIGQSLQGQDDEVRLKAEKLQAEAEQLFKQNTSESRLEAKKKYLENLPVWESLQEIEKQANTLNRLVEISYLSNDFKKGLEYSNQSLPLFQKFRNRAMEAETLSNIGGFLDVLGQTREAFPYLLKSIEILNELNDKKRLAVALNTIGILSSNIGEAGKAIDYLQRSLELRRESQDRLGEARTLINLGTIYDDTGEKRRAANYYSQGLEIAAEQKNFRIQSVALNNLGFVWSHLGEYQKALDYYQKALEIRRQNNDRSGEATILNNIATIYNNTGDVQTAKDFLEKALKIYQELGLKRNEARSLNSLGTMYSDANDETKALDLYQKALEIHRTLGNKEGQTSALRNIGVNYNGRGKYDEALPLLQEALKLAEEIEDSETIANTLMPLGQIFEAQNNLAKAEESYTRAIKIQRDVEVKEDLLESLYHYSQFLNRNGRQTEAIEKMEEGIRIIEDLRNSFASQSLRTGYLSQMQKYYSFYIRLLVDNHKLEPQKGFDALALKVSESARARSLLDSLGESRHDIESNIPKELLTQERILRQNINAKETQRIGAVREKSLEKAAVLEKELSDSLRQYQDLQTKIRQANPQFASLINPEPLSLEEIQTKVLDEGTVLLEYVLGEEQSFLFLVTKNSLEIYELPKLELIETEVRQTLENLKARSQSVAGETVSQRNERIKKADLSLENNLAETSKILLGPVADKIKNKRLAIVASGILQYLPFAALSNLTTRNYLIETNEIISLPSASIIPFLRQNKRNEKEIKNKIAILADPVFSENDPRLKLLNKQNQSNDSSTDVVMRNAQVIAPALRSDFSRLRFSRIEAEAISGLASENQRFVALDFAANLNAVKSVDLQRSGIVHFATHGIVNSQFPELSGIVLSLVDEKGQPQEGFLRLHDVYNLQIGANLVVLSACETALGKEVKGEGIVGLTRGFMFTGAKTVAASLWRVEDRATADLMKRFYQRLLIEKLPVATAFRQAQISLLKEKTSAHPFYWAGFTLQGDWK